MLFFPASCAQQALGTREADAHLLSWWQRLRTAIQLVKVLSGAFQQSAQALQIEEEMIKSLEQFPLEARSLSFLFKKSSFCTLKGKNLRQYC